MAQSSVVLFLVMLMAKNGIFVMIRKLSEFEYLSMSSFSKKQYFFFHNHVDDMAFDSILFLPKFSDLSLFITRFKLGIMYERRRGNIVLGFPGIQQRKRFKNCDLIPSDPDP